MQNSRAYYGMTYLEKKDLEETNIKNKVQLEYYTTKEIIDEDEKYGVEVIKKEYKDNGIDTQISSRNFICNNSQTVAEIINILKKHKVTPIGLNDVLEDLLKAN